MGDMFGFFGELLDRINDLIDRERAANELLVVIGNADVWGPPRIMHMEIVEDWKLRGRASWLAEEDGTLDRMAFYVRGSWRLARNFGLYEFTKGQRIQVTYDLTLDFDQPVVAEGPLALLGVAT